MLSDDPYDLGRLRFFDDGEAFTRLTVELIRLQSDINNLLDASEKEKRRVPPRMGCSD